MIWFTADTHFGHKNIIEFCKRPFVDVVEMRERMLNNINAVIKQQDELWHLGDFALQPHTEDVKELLKRIICKHTRLIVGNHDSSQHAKLFEQHYEAHRLKFNHHSFYLSHYPLRSWRADFQLHGHEHGTMKAYVGQLDVGVDSHDFKPWSIEEVGEFIYKRDGSRMIKDACRARHGDRLVVGGYGEVPSDSRVAKRVFENE